MNDLLILGYIMLTFFAIGIVVFVIDKFKKNENSK